jgi:predicted RNA-binding protein YlqC (UPF0109 family)
MIITSQKDVVPQVRLRSLLDTIVGAIAKSTSAPKIEHVFGEALFTLQVDPRDQGRFIGKLGGTIWAIQTVFWFAGFTQMGYAYSVKLFDHPLTNHKAMPIKFNPKWPRKKIENLVDVTIKTCLRSFASYSLMEDDATHLTINLKLEKYLECVLASPNFPEAFSTVMRVAGMSNGVQISTETIYA